MSRDTTRSTWPGPPWSEEPKLVSIDSRPIHDTDVDIIAIPAIGADPHRTWIAQPTTESAFQTRPRNRAVSKTHSATLIPLAAGTSLAPAVLNAIPQRSTSSFPNSPASLPLETPDGPQGWPAHELRHTISTARVLLYDHGKPAEDDSIRDLAQKLLKRLSDDEGRKPGGHPRPIYFICHSTGGIVAKAAVTLAAQSEALERIARDCYGFTFFSTPHQGSSYLASREFSSSIFDEMALKHPIPDKLRRSFAINHQELRAVDTKFKSISTDFKIFSFYETTDTELLLSSLTDPDAQPTPFRAPITSIKSAILELENEMEISLPTNHIGTAAFQGVTEDDLRAYLKTLKNEVDASVKLAKVTDCPLKVDTEVTVEINGFYEDTALGISSTSPLTLWSSRKSYPEFLRLGPRRCLEARLQEQASLSTSQGRRRMSTIGEPMDGLDNASVALPRSANMDERTAPAIQFSQPSFQGPPRTQQEKSMGAPSPNIRLQREATFPVDISPEPHLVPATASKASRLLSPIGLDEPLGNEARGSQLAESSQAGDGFIYNRARRQSSPSLLDPSSRLPRKSIELPPRASVPSRRADNSSHRFTWTHVPFNNTGWVAPILETVGGDRGRNSHVSLLHHNHWGSKHTKGRHAAPHARFVKPTCVHPDTETQRQYGVNSPSNCNLALYLPYLHWDRYRSLISRRGVIENRMKQGRIRPVSEDIGKSQSLETKMIWKYLGSDPPLHCRRTLDQYGYPNLRNTQARDDDQILYKRTKERPSNLLKTLKASKHGKKAGKGLRDREVVDGNVLIVDQLWLWVLDEANIVTMFPQNESSIADGRLYQHADLRNSIYNEVNGDLARRCENCLDFAALVILHSVTVLFERSSHPDLQILRIFEESISILTEKMTQSFKAFRARGFQNRGGDVNRNALGQKLTVEEQWDRESKMEEQNKRDLSALLELRDIDDELMTINRLLEQQKETVEQMVKEYEKPMPEFNQSPNGLRYLKEAIEKIEEYEKQISEMRGSATLAKDSYKDLLDIKQKQANVDEARMARWQADVSQTQSRSIMIFTIISIIFLPLTFFTGLFGMNVQEWSGTQSNPSAHTVIAFAVPITLAIIVIAVFVAFNTRLREASILARKIAEGVLRDIIKSVAKFLGIKWAFRRVNPRKRKPKLLKRLLERYTQRRSKEVLVDDDIWRDLEEQKQLPAANTAMRSETNRTGTSSVTLRRYFGMGNFDAKGGKGS